MARPASIPNLPTAGGVHAVTPDLGRVNGILAADATRAWVTGWRDDPTTQDVFEVRFAGRGESRLDTRGRLA